MPVVIDYSRDDLLTFISKETLEKKYQLRHTVVTPEGETVNELLEKSPQDAFARAATAFSSNEAHAQRLYDYASKLWFMFASPLLSNGGTDIGFPISCFLSFVPDSRQGLSDHYDECIWLSTMGGGIGGGWNAVRSNGISTSKGSESTGIIPFQKVVDSLMLGFQQGRQRRGKYSFNLDVSHPEIEEFIDLVNKKSGDESRRARHSFNCVSIPDKFMEAVRDNAQWKLIDPHTKQVRKEINAQELWAKILTSRMQEGTPYIHFIDRSNDKLPQAQKILGLQVNQTNLCVAPDTYILTSTGQHRIKDLANQSVEVWNGQHFSQTTVRKTGENLQLLDVTLSNGVVLQCTPQHRFYVVEGYNAQRNGQTVMKEAQQLAQGMKLIKYDLPTPLEGCDSLNIVEPYAAGFFSGDGCSYQGNSIIHFYGVKKNLIDTRFSHLLKYRHVQPDLDRETVYLNRHFEKFQVPLNAQLPNKLQWFAGLCDSDGCVARNQGNESLQVSSVRPEFLHQVRLMLQTVGVDSKVTLMHPERVNEMPDGKGGLKAYLCQPVHRLLINSIGAAKLKEMGFNLLLSRLELLSDNVPDRDASRFVEVVSVEMSCVSDTYCFTESGRGMGMFNGVLTGQCSEITLPTNEDRTAVCCLSSVNLSKYDEWKDNPQFISDLVEMLDNVLTVFIEKASLEPSFKKAVRSAIRERSIGLGAMGWHDLLQQRGIPFASSMAISLTRSVFSYIQSVAKETTFRLAEERGAAPDYLDAKAELIRQGVLENDVIYQIGLPVRNLHLLAIAPNATSSIICGNASPGIEPRFSNSYTQRTQNGIFVYKNPFLEKLLASLGKNTEEVWKQIKDERGSVQGLDFLTEQQKKTFATAMEIPQYWIIEQAGHRQEFICQAQSLNLFLPPDIDKAELHALHYYAWLQGNVKTLYYARSKSLQTVEQLNAKIERQVRDDYSGTDTSGEVQTVGQVGYGVEDDEVCLACEG